MSYTRTNAGMYKPGWGKVYLATPKRWWNVLNKEFQFTLDVAASHEDHMTDDYITQEEDALKQTWKGTIWLAPPWDESVLHYWTEKAVLEAQQSFSTVVGILPVRSKARWWHDHVLSSASEIRFIDGTLKFVRMDGESYSPFHVEPACLVVWLPGAHAGPIATTYPSTAKRQR